MAKSNQQHIWKSFLWAFAALGLLIFFGVHFKVPILAWVISLAAYMSGFVWQVIEYAADNETIGPDALMIIGAVIIGIWGAA